MREIASSVNITDISLGISCGYVQMAYITRALNDNNEFDILISKIEVLIKYYSNKIIDEFEWKEKGMDHSYYDMIYGLSGVAHYFYYYGKNDDIRIRITNWLVDIFNFSNEERVTGFFITPKNILNYDFKIKYSEGYIDLGLSHGVAGVLEVLAEGYKDRIKVCNLEQTIQNIYCRYKSTCKKNSYLQFPSILYKKSQILQLDFESRYSWCYGSLGILRVLYKVSKILNLNEDSKEFIESVKLLPINDLSIYKYSNPIFCHGYAGLYHILNLYNFENYSLNLTKYAMKVEEKIWEYYSSQISSFYIDEFKVKPKEILIENSIVDGIGSIVIPLIIGNIGKDVGFFSKMLFVQ